MTREIPRQAFIRGALGSAVAEHSYIGASAATSRMVIDLRQLPDRRRRGLTLGGNFGVVTSFTFRTFPVTDRDVVTLVFPDGTNEQAIVGWDEWLNTADREIWGMVNITVGSGSKSCTVVLARRLVTGRAQPVVSAA